MKQTFGLAVVFLCIAIFLLGVFHLFRTQKPIQNPTSKSLSEEVISPSPVSKSSTTTLFVPYWTMDSKKIPDTYNTVVYFGITADTNGINKTENGYLLLSKFMSIAPVSSQKFLTIRLMDSATNEKIISDNAFQQKIISDTITIAKENGFYGIVLDFEYNALAFDSVVNKTSLLSQNFAEVTHRNNLSFYQTLYGDTFYRLRPFDAEKIGKNADGIFVMAYDFHKANGNPGPNFPLKPLPDEEYSFIQMTKDFTKKIPPQKLTILFGLFGYDWTINNKNQSLGQAGILTTLQAQKKFTPSCLLKDCKVGQDALSEEQHVEYKDADGRTHEVWFEDMDSAAKKQEYLKSQGIFSIGFWAYSYF